MPDQRFDFTGSGQTFVVPAGVTELEVECAGAEGGFSGFQRFGTSSPTTSNAVVGSWTRTVFWSPGDLVLVSTDERWNGGGSGPVVTPPDGFTLVGESPIYKNFQNRSFRTRVWSRVAQADDPSITITSTAVSTGQNGTSYSLVAVRAVTPLPGMSSMTISAVVAGGRDLPAVATAWSPVMPTPPAGRQSMVFMVTPADAPIPSGWDYLISGALYLQNHSSFGEYVSMNFSAAQVSNLVGRYVAFCIDTTGVPIADPGEGGRVTARVPVTPGTTLTVQVGGQPARGAYGGNRAGGYGGGNGGQGSAGAGAGGGGSRLLAGSTVLVAAGAGGGAGGTAGAIPHGNGGDGGGAAADHGSPLSGTPSGGRGATTASAGAGGASAVTAGQAGSSVGVGGYGGAPNLTSAGAGGGGGGGYRGGGGGGFGAGNGGGGGGGSSYVIGTATTISNAVGGNLGHGYIIIKYGPDRRAGLVVGIRVGGSGVSCS